ncbi:MAG: DUF2299 domain-containing protein [Thermoproteus sp.]
MDLDKEVERWLRSLGLNLVVPPNAPEPFHISVAPPTGLPVVEVVRPKDANLYVIAMGIAVHPDHKSALASMKEEERRKFLLDLKRAVLQMGVDFAFLPPDAEVPEAIHISKPVLIDGLDAHTFVEEYYRVRNAGLMVIMSFSETFRRPKAERPSLYA